MTEEEFIAALMSDGYDEAEAEWMASLNDEWYPSVHKIIRRAEQVLQEEEEYENETL